MDTRPQRSRSASSAWSRKPGSTATPTREETVLYLYGIIPANSPAGLFEDVDGVDPASPVELVCEGALAAVTGRVSPEEFGEEAIESNLLDPLWLEQKVRAHDRVLDAAVGHTAIVPFRFGAIYRSKAQIRSLLSERSDFAETLARLGGTVEIGVQAFLRTDEVRVRAARERGVDEGAASSGRSYLERRQVDRQVDEDLRQLAADYAEESHARLTASAREGRLNPLPRPEPASDQGVIVMNGAYLVDADDVGRFRDALSELEASFDGIARYRITGPWPPYNFVDEVEPS